MILIFFSVLLGLSPPPSKEKNRVLQTKFYFALLFLGFGFAMLVRSFIPIELPQTSTKRTLPSQEYEQIGPLRFYRDPDFALELAQKSRKPVLIDFYADWCANCKDFKRLVRTNKKLQDILRRALLVKIYDTDPIFEKYKRDPRFPELKIGLPFFVVLRPDAKLHWKSTNYKDLAGMEKALKGKF